MGMGLCCSLSLSVLLIHPQSFFLGSSKSLGTSHAATNWCILPSGFWYHTLLPTALPRSSCSPYFFLSSVMPTEMGAGEHGHRSFCLWAAWELLKYPTCITKYVHVTMCYWAQGFYSTGASQTITVCFVQTMQEWILLNGATSLEPKQLTKPEGSVHRVKTSTIVLRAAFAEFTLARARC
jgi:hypothetical protein